MRSHLYRSGSEIDFALLDKSLSVLTSSRDLSRSTKLSLVLEYDELEGWIHSDDRVDRIRAIRLLGMAEENFVRVYELLMSAIRNDSDSAIRTESLLSLASNSSICKLLNLSDVTEICELARDRYGNVRIAAIAALGRLPALSSVIEILLERALSSEKEGLYAEYQECLGSLAEHADSQPDASTFLVEEFSDEIGRRSRPWDERRIGKVRSLILALEQCGATLDSKAVGSVYNLVNDHSVPMSMRRALIQLFGRVAVPDEVNSKLMRELVDSHDARLRPAVNRSLAAFIRRCRGRVDYVRASYPNLGKMQTRLLNLWSAEQGRDPNRVDYASMNLIRSNIMDLDRLLRSYGGIGFLPTA